MKVRELIKALESEDWFLVTQKDNARQYKHPTGKRVTVAGDDDSDLSPGALAIMGVALQ